MAELMIIQQMCWLVHSLWLFSGAGSIISIVIDPLLWSQFFCLLFVLSRCSREHLCQRHMQPNHWLWSFEPTNQCVTVQSLQPSNQSKDEQTQVGCCRGSKYWLLFVFGSTSALFLNHSPSLQAAGFGSIWFKSLCREKSHESINQLYFVPWL